MSDYKYVLCEFSGDLHLLAVKFDDQGIVKGNPLHYPDPAAQRQPELGDVLQKGNRAILDGYQFAEFSGRDFRQGFLRRNPVFPLFSGNNRAMRIVSIGTP